MKRTTCDTVIVGGGPAGSQAAFRLARAGRHVVVLDAETFPRVKLCAGWVTPAVWRELELDPRDYPHTLQPFGEATLELGGQVHATRWDGTVSFGIIRREFDDHLLRRAGRHGAEIHEGIRAKTIRAAGSAMVVETGEHEFHAPWLLGAGGHHCPVARRLGGVDAAEPVVVARESETRIGRERLAELTPRSGTPELLVESDFRGYGWYFSKGDFLNIGLGCMSDGRDLKSRCAAMVERLRSDGRLPADLPIEPFRGHAYAIHVDRPRTCGGPGWMLLGDAAGLARGISGEGIGPAVASASLAAELLLAGRGEDYPRELARRFGSGNPSLLARFAGTLPRPLLDAAAQTVCRTPSLRRRLIFEGAFGMEGASPA